MLIELQTLYEALHFKMKHARSIIFCYTFYKLNSSALNHT